MRVLHLDASGRINRSHTRRLSSLLIHELRAADPSIEVVRRDLIVTQVPPVDEGWIAAAFTAPDRRTAPMRDALRLSDELVEELISTDVYVFGVPMYNFSVPSSFKAYIDQVVRIGRTFLFEPEDRGKPYKGLLHGKKLFLLSARGDAGYGPGGRYEAWNHLDPFIRTAFGFMGVTDVTIIATEYDEFGGISLEESRQEAERQVRAAVAQLAVRQSPPLGWGSPAASLVNW